MMTRNEFTELLDIYGADLSRWPQDKLKAALTLTEQDSVARDAFDRTLALEDMLRGDDMPDSDLPALESRIMSAIADLPMQAPAAAPTARSGFFGWRATYVVAPPVGLLAIAVFGFVLGMQPSVQHESLVHPVYYQADQILADDTSMFEGRIF